MSNPEDTEENRRFFIKYKEVDDKGKGYQYLMPLMRISEMYLIAAECLDEETLKYQYLNQLRNARKVASVGEEGNIMEEIEKEYRREFIGEGQLFWFFKRQNECRDAEGVLPVPYSTGRGGSQRNELLILSRNYYEIYNENNHIDVYHLVDVELRFRNDGIRGKKRSVFYDAAASGFWLWGS